MHTSRDLVFTPPLSPRAITRGTETRLTTQACAFIDADMTGSSSVNPYIALRDRRERFPPASIHVRPRSHRMTPARRALTFTGILVCVLAGWGARAADSPRHFFLELDIAIERGGVAGVFFDFGDGIWGENSAWAKVPYGAT